MRRRFQIVIDVDVEVMDLTRERVLQTRAEREAERDAEVSLFHTDPPTALSIAREQLLLEQLLKSPELLEHYLRVGVIQELTIGGVPRQFEQNLDDNTFFRALFEGLPPRERHHFRQALARGDFVEKNEEFFDSFHFDITGVAVSEVS